jgi:hypothetical protein
LEGVHPNVLQRYYGTTGRPKNRPCGCTGAGHDALELQQEEIASIARNVSGVNDPEFIPEVVAPTAPNPFSNPEHLNIYGEALHRLDEENVTPEHYGLDDSELHPSDREMYERITLGRSGRKFLDIPLPPEVWKPRAVRWAQAINALIHCKNALGYQAY